MSAELHKASLRVDYRLPFSVSLPSTADIMCTSIMQMFIYIPHDFLFQSQTALLCIRTILLRDVRNREADPIVSQGELARVAAYDVRV